MQFSNMRIRIYSKTWTALTTLYTVGNADFNNLSYKSALGEIGSARFVMRLDSAKCTASNLQHFNKVEIQDDDGTVRWNGVIVEKNISFDTVEVRCYGLMYLLKKRITGDAESYNDDAENVVTTLLANANVDEATGITAGTIDAAVNVQITFNEADVFTAIKKIADTLDYQFYINTSRQLVFQSTIGSDLSASLSFRYDISTIVNANILNFQVNDNGADIVTKTAGKSSGFNSSQEDASLTTAYGLLEEAENFREVDDNASLDSLTSNNNRDAELSPTIVLNPSVTDNFEVGDIVAVLLQNRLVDIDADYQILEKVVEFIAGQKKISVVVISNTSDFFRQLNQLTGDVDLLSREV